MLTHLIRFIILPLLFLSLSAQLITAASVATLENSAIKLEFDTSKGLKITSFYSKKLGRELLQSESDIPLYQLDILQNGKQLSIIPTMASAVTFDSIGEGNLDIHVLHPTQHLEVTCTISLPNDSEAARFAIRVNREDLSVRIGRIFYPGYALSLGDDLEKFNVLMPVADGQLIVDPKNSMMDRETRGYNYPGIASVQLMAFYNSQGGLYTFAQDGNGHFKSLEVKRFGNGIVLLFSHITYDQEEAIITVPYSVEVGAFTGDWSDAADHYKKWAITQPWCETYLEDRILPAQLTSPSYYLALNVRKMTGPGMSINMSNEIPNLLLKWQEELGIPITAILLGWEKLGYWTSPDYFPPWQGWELFQTLLESIRSQGNMSMLFLSGLHYTLEKESRNGADYFKIDPSQLATVTPSAIAGPDGSPEIVGAPDGQIGQYLNICPATPYAHTMLRNNFVEAITKGIDNVQVDGMVGGGSPPCYSDQHSHPPVGGNTTFNSLSSILKRLSDESKTMNYQTALSLEEPGELYIPYVDMFHTREYLQAYWPRDGKGVLGIPLFSYLYHEYALGYGGDHAYLTMSSENLDMAIYAQAMNLITGKMPAGAIWMIMPYFDDLHPSLKQFIKDIASLLKTDDSRYILYGKMVDADQEKPVVKKVQFKYDGTDHSFDSYEIMSQGFELRNGTKGVLYINTTDQTQTKNLDFADGNNPVEALISFPKSGLTIKSGEQYIFPPRGILFLIEKPVLPLIKDIRLIAISD